MIAPEQTDKRSRERLLAEADHTLWRCVVRHTNGVTLSCGVHHTKSDGKR